MLRSLSICTLFLVCALALNASASALSTPPTRSIIPDQLACGVCEEGVEKALPELRANATAQEIEDALDKVCALLPAAVQAVCKEGAAAFAGLVVSSDTYVWIKYSPRAVCGMLGGLCTFECCMGPITPEQIHLALTGVPGQMRVMWTTLRETPDSTVQWGTENGWETGQWQFSTTGTQFTYTAAGWIGTLHEALLTNVQPGKKYYYRVGSTQSASAWFKPQWSENEALNFIGPSQNTDPIKFGLLGDAGASDMGDMTALRLAELTQRREIDKIVHIGDLSYADGYQPLWDRWLRKLATSVSFLPYMTLPGNHEGFYNFAAYKARFHMPYESSNSTGLYYSWNSGPVHFIALRSEGPDGVKPFDFTNSSAQYQWLYQDLVAATQPAARALRPWIIVMAHRPLYCAAKKSPCEGEAAGLRKGLEPLFEQFKVNVYFGAHVHHYERTLPVVNNGVVAGTLEAPKGTVHILSGAGGNKERLDNDFYSPRPAWSTGAQLAVTGFNVCTANATVFACDFILSGNGTVADSFAVNLWA